MNDKMPKRAVRNATVSMHGPLHSIHGAQCKQKRKDKEPDSVLDNIVTHQGRGDNSRSQLPASNLNGDQQ